MRVLDGVHEGPHGVTATLELGHQLVYRIALRLARPGAGEPHGEELERSAKFQLTQLIVHGYRRHEYALVRMDLDHPIPR